VQRDRALQEGTASLLEANSVHTLPTMYTFIKFTIVKRHASLYQLLLFRLKFFISKVHYSCAKHIAVLTNKLLLAPPIA
jgi:hypothetical protein